MGHPYRGPKVRHLIVERRSAAAIARVTVVNDYPEFLELMHDLLGEQAGHQVTAFDGEHTSFEEIVASQPELLVIDVLLEGARLTGWGLVPLARADDRLRLVPIIVFSSEIAESEQRLKELAELGNVRLLRKPISADDLLQTADEMLRTPPTQ